MKINQNQKKSVKITCFRGQNARDGHHTERALKAFLKGESLGKLIPTTKELFPLPEEKRACA